MWKAYFYRPLGAESRADPRFSACPQYHRSISEIDTEKYQFLKSEPTGCRLNQSGSSLRRWCIAPLTTVSPQEEMPFVNPKEVKDKTADSGKQKYGSSVCFIFWGFVKVLHQICKKGNSKEHQDLVLTAAFDKSVNFWKREWLILSGTAAVYKKH